MSTNKKINVIALIADVNTITLYCDDGQQVVLNSNEYRTKEIVDQVMPLISSHRKAQINISSYALYSQFEEKTGGFIRFFRIAKYKVASLFGSDPDEKPSETPKAIPMTASEIEAQGFRDIPETMNPNDTVVAVVGHDEEARAIPEMEKLKKQFENSVAGSEIGMVNFLSRISKVIDKRGHSVQDLLKFLEKADLPIADDGSVIAYKSLIKKDDFYVDCHTRKVNQKVGSHVFMDPSKVDPSRRRECSQGLHIARRDYLGSFSGNVIVLCKINPEDFIAVPQYSPSKVRVSGYHILFELSTEARRLLRSNKVMTTDDEASNLLATAISGQHTPVLETVEIKGEYGAGIIITSVSNGGITQAVPQQTHKGAQALNVDDEPSGPPVTGLTPKELREQAEKARQTTPQKPKNKENKKVEPTSKTSSSMTKAEKAKQLFSKWAKDGKESVFDELVQLKMKSKKSYKNLGLEPHQINSIHKHQLSKKDK